MTDKIDPCPFCGGPADMEEIKGASFSSWSVGCRNMEGPDECIGQQSMLTFARKCDAVTAWNRRSAPTPDIDAMRNYIIRLTGSYVDAPGWFELAEEARQYIAAKKAEGLDAERGTGAEAVIGRSTP